MRKWLLLFCTALLFFGGACTQQREETGQSSSASVSSAADSAAASSQIFKAEEKTQEIPAPDFASCFQEVNGGAVLHDAASGETWLYQDELCTQRVSPYSTFKIISALIGLESGVLSDVSDTMTYSGAQYPNPQWNRELTLQEAFSSSCVWYFRQVLDEAGREQVQVVLNKLSYGNCDISEWEGSGVNPMPELNGFWLSSSLLISPKEQVDVLWTLFEEGDGFDSENIALLKQLMRLEEKAGAVLYGKTGTGPEGQGWFVGFLEKNEERKYISVYLPGPVSGSESSGNMAREITEQLLKF